LESITIRAAINGKSHQRFGAIEWFLSVGRHDHVVTPLNAER
jgi:hypothetical protein